MPGWPQILIMNEHSIAGQLLSLSITHIATVPAILLLTGAIGIVSNGNILTDGRDERKHLVKIYNYMQFYLCW